MAEDSFWHVVDQYLQERGQHHGIPVGFGELDITTKDRQLLELLKECVPENQSDYDNSEKPLEVIDYSDGSTWTHYHSFTMKRQWKGRFYEVHLFRNQQTKKVRHLLTKRSDAHDRLDLWLETGAVRRTTAMNTAEETARQRLFEELTETQYSQYLLNDAILERGQSGIVYMIRKNRPTIALRQDNPNSGFRPLCVLCMHPWAYYTGSWAGAMPPSDEVLTHLLYIRTDEHLYWRRANQIPVDHPRSGI